MEHLSIPRQVRAVPGSVRDRDDTPLDWMADGLCTQTDPEAFFPDKGGSTRAVKKLCAECEVREKCLAYALATNQRYGVWGGLSEKERAALVIRTRELHHGTRTMFQRGCKTESRCPRDPETGLTCREAALIYGRAQKRSYNNVARELS